MQTQASQTADLLANALPDGRILADPDVVRGYQRDEAAAADHGTALAVVRPRNTAEVADVVRVSAEHGIPLVPRGGGTGLTGGANAVDGSVILTFEAMNRILEIDPEERLAVVQPGVVNDDLRAACAAHGLWYPPDPASASASTIGGNVSTNAGGLSCVKYGVTRDYVLEVEAVVRRGDVVRFGARTAKNAAGYDLARLFVSAGGTLGVLTQIALRLRGGRSEERTVFAYFDDAARAGRAASAVWASGVVPSMLELVDGYCLRAIDAWKNMGLADGGEVLLMAQTDTPGPQGEDEADQLLRCFVGAGAGWCGRSDTESEAAALFQARRLVYPALEQRGAVLNEDICVPRKKVPEMLTRIGEVAWATGLYIACISHVGDGNIHPMIVTPRDDTAAQAAAQRALRSIVDHTITIGGTVTGEHGVGLMKRDSFAEQVGPVVLDVHRALKRSLDPAGIFNPGKIFVP